MGASGSAWIKPKKRKGLQPDSLKGAPHPRFVRAGQRYFPLAASNKRKATIRITRVVAGADRCEGRREDENAAAVRLAVARLLAVDDLGAPRFYSFVGHAQRSYATHAIVVERSTAWLTLVCPEFHPGVPITVAAGAVPAALRAPGTWLACRGDLGAPAAAKIELRAFLAVERTFDPERYAPPAIDHAAEAPARREAPALGQGCGDIVLFPADDALEGAGRADVYVTGHPPPVEAGAGVYVHRGGEVRVRRTLSAKRRHPNGVTLVLAGDPEPVAVPADLARPRVGVAGGAHGQQEWVWRTWRREDERVPANA